MVITRELRTAIANGAPVEEIEKLARQAGMVTLFEHGCMAVEQGHTTLGELVQMLGESDGR